MPVDKKQIKKALDHFENDEYSEAQDILKKEIAKHRDEWIEKKLELKGSADDADADADDADADADDDADADTDEGDE
jgi:hypothetical protein